ncbi:MAG: NADH-quinone oxidoreductase subunit N, partial [Verrucomicrobiales bacterium]
LLMFATDCHEATIWGVYRVDHWSHFYKGIALVATIIVLIISLDYKSVLKQYTSEDETHAGIGEFYALPLFACAGLMWMASAVDLITIFVALELVTMSSYVLVTYMRRNVGSLEAGVKYLILGALSTGFLVYGITWTFGITGETNLAKIGEVLAAGEVPPTAAVFAFALLIVGLGFKVAAAPFQIWVPDVYQGAATPITAFLSVGSKAAGFIVLIRVVTPFIDSPVGTPVIALLTLLAAASLIYGNLAAIPQTNLKRLLAYSSISHAGFLLMAVTALGSDTVIKGPDAQSTIAFYLACYLAMTMLAFAVIAIVRARLGGEDLKSVEGLGKRSPLLAVALVVAFASLAGLPLTAGFMGKLFIFNIAVQQGQYWLIAAAIVGVAAGFYYYFKAILSMFRNSGQDGDADAAVGERIHIGLLTKLTIIVLIGAVILFGFYPQPLLPS